MSLADAFNSGNFFVEEDYELGVLTFLSVLSSVLYVSNFDVEIVTLLFYPSTATSDLFSSLNLKMHYDFLSVSQLLLL